MVIAWTVFAVTVGACNNKDDDPVWVRFNHDDDVIAVEIRPGEFGEPVSTELTSSTGEATVGTVRVEPGAGPVGTEHLVVVNVLDEFEDRVQRVDMIAESGDRGEQEFSMERDSADLGIWVLDLTSYGVDQEERIDLLRFSLWEISAVALPPDEPGE